MGNDKSSAIAGKSAPAGEILAVLRRQRDLYERLQQLASKQRAMLADEDTRPLLVVLNQRQQVMAELTRLGKQIEPIRANWSHAKDGWSATERQEADSLVADVDRRLRQLLESDEEDAQRLRLRKQSVQSKLDTSRGQAQALAAYRSTSTGAATSRFEETHSAT